MAYGQTLDSELEQLRAAGYASRNIYREKVTGARADRRELLRMLCRLAPGDVVTVTRIDRLARSTFDLFGIVKRIVGTSTGRSVVCRALCVSMSTDGAVAGNHVDRVILEETRAAP